MFRFLLRALLVVAAAPVLAAKPAAPDVLYYSGDKQLLFDWNYVPQANYYEVWFKANSGAAWAKFGERPSWNPHWVQNISAHLLNWADMRWEVKACNPSGCTGTGPIDIGSTIVLTPIFFTKAQPKNFDRLGETVAVSEDAQTAIASTWSQVIVFHRVGGQWKREAALQPARQEPGTVSSVAISGDGNVVVVGYPEELNYDEGVSDPPRGAVFVFRRNGSTWTEERRLVAPRGRLYGNSVGISEAGDRITIDYFRDEVEDANSATDILTRSATGWSTATIVNPGATYCTPNRLSGDGQTIARRCSYGGAVRAELLGAENAWGLRTSFPLQLPYSPTGYSWGPLAVNYDASTLVSPAYPAPVAESNYQAANWAPQAAVFRRTGSAWQQVATLKPDRFQYTNYSSRSLFGERIALSRNGEYIAVGDQHSTVQGLVEPPPTAQSGNFPHGGVYVFERNGNGYRLRRHVGVTTQSPNDADPILGGLAFGDAGKTLAIGHPGARSNGQGCCEGRNDTSLNHAGALWLY
ncbi:MAG TPA: hypothetical protein VMF52_11745 [Steroidobacteraceae bacterium]|nr:hypothetical protein [Steroidobacteraceae bacterium]